MTIFDPRMAPKARMPSGFTSVPLPKFGGLRLRDDPQDVGWDGAIDMLNVDLDRFGRVRSRDGFSKLSTANAANEIVGMAPYYESDGTSQLLAATAVGDLTAYTTAGARLATHAAAGLADSVSIARFGGPSAEVAYITSTFIGWASSPSPAAVKKWDGASFATVAALSTYAPMAFAVTPSDNRLAFSDMISSKINRVRFSGAGTPETIDADDFVDLTPGDGERIRAMVTWREQLIVFKETKFFRFYGNNTDSSGDTEFNYQAVVCGVGPSSARAVTVSPDGVYFADRSGIYLTTGGPPQLVSKDIDPIFRGSLPATFAGLAIDQTPAYFATLAIHWHHDRLYVSYRDTGGNRRTLVKDPDAGWLFWSLPATCFASWRISTDEELVFGFEESSSLDNEVGRFGAAYTTDNTAAITSRYRTGFADLGTPGAEKILRVVLLDGYGTPTLKVAVNDGSLDAGSAVTLGTAPAIAQGQRRRAFRGRNFSLELGAATPWGASRAVAHMGAERTAGLRSP